MHGYLETFDEKVMKTTALLNQLIFFMKDSEHLPLILSLVEPHDENLDRWCRLFYALTQKFNVIKKLYRLRNMPMGAYTVFLNVRDATLYWTNCVIGKAEHILSQINSGTLNEISFHHQLTVLLTKVNAKLKRLFNRSVWNKDWPVFLDVE